jgi:hypothetical protein
MEPGRFSALARRLFHFGAMGLFLAMAAGCVSPTGPAVSDMKARAKAESEVRSQMSLAPNEWRIARKYAGIARDFYGYEYIPARVERYSDSGDAIEVDLAFRMPDGGVRRVRVTGTVADGGEEERRTARVEPLRSEPDGP